MMNKQLLAVEKQKKGLMKKWRGRSTFNVFKTLKISKPKKLSTRPMRRHPELNISKDCRQNKTSIHKLPPPKSKNTSNVCMKPRADNMNSKCKLRGNLDRFRCRLRDSSLIWGAKKTKETIENVKWKNSIKSCPKNKVTITNPSWAWKIIVRIQTFLDGILERQCPQLPYKPRAINFHQELLSHK